MSQDMDIEQQTNINSHESTTVIRNNGTRRDVRRKLHGKTKLRRRGQMIRNRGCRLAKRVWRRVKPTGRSTATVVEPSPPINELRQYIRQLQDEFGLLRRTFRQVDTDGMKNWPKEWRMARELVEGAPPPARLDMVDGNTQTETQEDQPDEMNFKDATHFAKHASLWEISKNLAMSMLFYRAFVHGLAYGSRTHTMPDDYSVVPETHHWKRLLPQIEKYYNPTASTQNVSQYYVTKSQNTPTDRPRMSKRNIKPREILDL